jgi:hypothetical protein
MILGGSEITLRAYGAHTQGPETDGVRKASWYVVNGLRRVKFVMAHGPQTYNDGPVNVIKFSHFLHRNKES